MKKLSNGLKTLYGYGIVAALFLGGATVLGFIAAIIIGGETGTAIATFIYKGFFPRLIIASDIIVLIGLAGMYLAGEKTMFLARKKAAPARKAVAPAKG